jgi:hypothetical protein
MGYYDTAHVQPNAGGQPYNVRDILLATQGITGGVDKLVADAGVDRKAQQQMKANMYVTELLGKATPENYQQQLLSAGTMSPYASPELMKQVDTSRAGFHRGEDILHRDAREAVQDFQWGVGSNREDTRDAYKVQHDKDLMTFDREKFNKTYGLQLSNAEFEKYKFKVTTDLQREQNQIAQNALYNKPTQALVTGKDGVQTVQDVPYYATIGNPNIRKLENVKATDELSGLSTTKKAGQQSFAKLASDPVAYEANIKSAFTAAVRGKDWITPRISDTKLSEVAASAGSAIKASPELQQLWNNATTDKQRGAVVMKAAEMIKEPTHPVFRLGSGIINKLLPDEYEIDVTGTKVGNKAAQRKLLQ